MHNTRIQMLEVEHSLEHLNRTLADRDISPADVISIHEKPAGAMAIGDHNRAKYRVFYRG